MRKLRFCAFMLASLVAITDCASRPNPQPVVPGPSPIDASSRDSATPSPSPQIQDAAVEAASPSPLIDAAIPPATATSDASTPPIPVARIKFFGTNLSGAEFGSNVPGVHGRDYLWPSHADADYFLTRGMNHFRIPFRHQRLQPQLLGPLEETEWARMSDLVRYITGKGASVAIEPHDSFRFKGKIVSEIEIADFWGRVAARFKDKDNPRVQINVTNEPHDMPTELVVSLDNASLRAIRSAGFAGLVLVPGNAFSGAWSWLKSFYGISNAVAMPGVVDPGSSMAYEVHGYGDADASGTYVGAPVGECVSEAIFVDRLAGFTAWLRAAPGRLGFLGEYSAPNTPRCREAIRRMLAYVAGAADVYLGIDWWGSGSWSAATSWISSIGPADPEKPQMAWLKAFLSTSPSPSPLSSSN